MNTIGSLASPDPVAVGSRSLPDLSARGTIEPPSRPVTEAGRAGGRGVRDDAGPTEFAAALADEMDAAAAAPDGPQAPDSAAGPRPDRARVLPPAADDDGEVAPPDGNVLPPWLAALPPAPPSAARIGVEPAAASAILAPLAGDAAIPAGDAASAIALPGAAPAGAALTGSPVTTPDMASAAATGAEASRTPSRPEVSPDSVLPTSASAAAAFARADAPSPAEAALERVARFAAAPPPPGAPAPGDALPPTASDVARQVAEAVGRQAAASGAAAAGGASPPPSDRRYGARAPVAPAVVPLASAAAPSASLAATSLPPGANLVVATDGEHVADATALAAAEGAPPLPSLAASPPSPTAAPAATASASLPPIDVAVGAPDWDRQLGERVGVLVEQGLGNAQLKLSPAHLGPLEIRISVRDDQASVWFGTHSHATREALEAAAPRLRDLLGAQGFAQVGVSVDLQQQAPRQDASGGRHAPEFSFAAGAATATEGVRGEPRATAGRPAPRSRVDAFA